ncbi:MAG TPA: helix-turn-helix transcriptional regulator [Trebonia sp.]
MTAALAVAPAKTAKKRASVFAILLGKRLRKVREEQRMSLMDVEEDSGGTIGSCSLGMYERAERAISVDRLNDICRFYEIPLSDVLDPPPLVSAAFRAITGAARSGATEQIRQTLLAQAELPRWDQPLNGAYVIAAMAELIGGPL